MSARPALHPVAREPKRYYPNLAPDDTPELRERRKDLIRDDFLKHTRTGSVAGVLKALNITARDGGVGAELFKLVRADLRKIHERYVIVCDEPADYKIASAVLSRSLGWNKYAERITYEQIAAGLGDQEGYSVEQGGRFLSWLPAFAGTRVSERTLNRRMPKLLAWGMVTRFKIAHGRQYDFHYLYGTPDIIRQLMLLHLEQAGRDRRALRELTKEGRQAKEDLILELVEELVRRDTRQFPRDALGYAGLHIRQERLEALTSDPGSGVDNPRNGRPE